MSRTLVDFACGFSDQISIIQTPLPLQSSLVNILVRWNRTSGNLEIRVPVLGNRLFCAWWLIHFCWNIGQDLAASAVRSSLYQCLNQNCDSVCTKTIIWCLCSVFLHLLRHLNQSKPTKHPINISHAPDVPQRLWPFYYFTDPRDIPKRKHHRAPYYRFAVLSTIHPQFPGVLAIASSTNFIGKL